MDFNLSREQRMLRDAANDFLANECPKARVREIEKSADGHDRALWEKMGELGWMGLIVPEAYGGSGGGFLDLVVLLETMGYHLCPSPYFATVLLGSVPILACGSEARKEALLPELAAAKRIATLALTETGGGIEAEAIRVPGRIRGSGFEIDGVKLFVSYAHVADVLLCAVRTDESAVPEMGVTLFLVERDQPGISIGPMKSLGDERPCEVAFSGVRVTEGEIVGGFNRGWPIVESVLGKASVALGAQMIGGAQAVVDMALQYAKERTQFGHPIGSFQSIQHYFADMWADILGSRDLLYRAAWKITENLPAAGDVAMARARAGKTYRRVTTLGHQIFGAIGFTEEHDMHLYHRRSIAMDLALGGAECSYRSIANGLFDEAGA
ncbi:MAG: acyl-CoA/acyl-ACP dehydrogenase [Syntrophales bacterium]|jgi:alkylation response protein AidB-like acyl-CoA dehydrogenase|nr:acyl-CoA/acyl-ACP dehydrogenase [Syntrophales bacterium]MDD4339262.1 acyl-CoA/acyl-ACP dehydrogenase [Syntrophales bacterium]HOG07079.1 acyl-CoA dehydrogenase family protein [Syntrophales bacterium]HOS77794.1 acyl-CoA dehydrogenase family protein [Syntrophales bacterium]HPB70847.1 acyl-CoA dehydrogenase family protein [Syntrophales bacterium]